MNINEKRYPNISKAVAFRIAFTNVLCGYGNVGFDEIEKEICSLCGYSEQIADFLVPKSAIKKEYSILATYHYGVSINIRDILIDNFNITDDDFRPIRNKTGDVVYYQISPMHTMLPIISQNRIRKLSPCKCCGSIQYREKEYLNENGFPFSFISQEGLLDLHDVNKTFEEFDMFLPKWVVSRRVYDFLISKYPRMNFEPIFLK